MGGQAGKIYLTTNGGESWEPVTSGTTMFIYDIYYQSSELLFAVGQAGLILKSTNGGTSWTKLPAITNRSLLSMVFADQLNGYIAGEYGNLLTTTDGGDTWTELPEQTFLGFAALAVSGLRNVYVSGDNGIILYDQAEPLSIKLPETLQPSSLKLYPNPAHDYIIIKAGYYQEGVQMVRIFDTSGRLVYENRCYSNDNHYVNLKLFDRGIYFISIEGQNKSETVKLVVY